MLMLFEKKKHLWCSRSCEKYSFWSNIHCDMVLHTWQHTITEWGQQITSLLRHNALGLTMIFLFQRSFGLDAVGRPPVCQNKNKQHFLHNIQKRLNYRRHNFSGNVATPWYTLLHYRSLESVTDSWLCLFCGQVFSQIFFLQLFRWLGFFWFFNVFCRHFRKNKVFQINPSHSILQVHPNCQPWDTPPFWPES